LANTTDALILPTTIFDAGSMIALALIAILQKSPSPQ
jgi:hypothetical protein